MIRPAVSVAIALTIASLLPHFAVAQQREDQIVRDAIATFNQIMANPNASIPRRMLNDAAGVAIIPGVIKGSFVVGARHGTGVLVVRDESGGWHAPIFVKLTGGNIGWQVGVQSTDVVLVFKTRRSVDSLFTDTFTIGADAGVAAGPVGGEARAGTTGALSAEVYSYSRSRGLFAGVSLDGSVIKIDQVGNANYYRSPAPGQPVVIPPAAEQLVGLIAPYAGEAPMPTVNSAVPTQPASAIQVPPTSVPGQSQILAQQYSRQEADVVRDQLAALAPELYEMIDPAWQQYLALPSEVFSGQGQPSLEALNESLLRFERVKMDPNYRALTSEPKFQSVYGLLQHYEQALSQTQKTLQLPLPPQAPATGNTTGRIGF